MMELRFLKPEDDAWKAFLCNIEHDFYHLPEYLSLTETQTPSSNAEAVLITAGNNYFFLPYLIRSLKHTKDLPETVSNHFDITSPYGYPGPLIGADDTSFTEAALQTWKQALRNRGMISAFIRMHPLYVAHNKILEKYGALVSRGKTVSCDLSISEDEMWHQTEHGHKQRINKAVRKGLKVQLDNETNDFSEFLQIYSETMDRINADSYYFFPRSYFDGLKRALGEKLWLSTVRDTNNKVLAAGLFTESHRIVQFHLSGTSTQALPLAPSALMLDSVRRWAKHRGNRYLHLGGGLGAQNDSLYRFKAGFSKLSLPFYTWQLIFDETLYTDLVHICEAKHPLEQPSSFFPAYRRGLESG